MVGTLYFFPLFVNPRVYSSFIDETQKHVVTLVRDKSGRSSMSIGLKCVLLISHRALLLVVVSATCRTNQYIYIDNNSTALWVHQEYGRRWMPSAKFVTPYPDALWLLEKGVSVVTDGAEASFISETEETSAGLTTQFIRKACKVRSRDDTDFAISRY